MAKAKKVLSTVLVALFTVFTVLSYVPAQTTKAAAGPKVQIVAQPNAEYKVGDRVLVKFNSPNYKGIVQYRAFLWNRTTQQFVQEIYKDYPGFWYKPVCVGTSVFTIDVFYPQEPGTYYIGILVKAKGAKTYSSYVYTSTFTVKAKEEAAIKEFAPVADVTVDEGAVATLPATVKAVMTDGTEKEVAVKWDAVDTTKAGEYTVNGTVEGTTLKPAVKVVVKAVALKVESVSAINAKQVIVKFNKEVDATDAETLAKYAIEGNNPTTAVLNSDKKTVKLTFANASEVEVENAVFVVEPVRLAADTDKTSERYVGLFTYEDTVKPELVSVTAKTNGTYATSLTVVASEPISSAVAKINGSPVSINFANTDTATITGLYLEVGKDYTLELINLTDMSANANKNTLITKVFSVTVDKVAPTYSVAAKGDKQILVTFSKPMNASTVTAAFNGTNSYVKDELLGNISYTTATVVTGTDNTQFLITVSSTLYATKTARTLTVVFPNTITDSLGNAISAGTATVTLAKDTVKPAPTGYKVIKNASGQVTAIEVNFSEGLKVDSNPAEPMVVNMNGVDVTSTLLGGLTAGAIAAGDKKVTFNAATQAAITGKYAFTFPANLVGDQAETTNYSDSFSYTIDFGTATTKFNLTSATATNNVITVVFGRAVRGGAVANSATDVNNYTLNGQPLPAGTIITLNSAQDTATITLPAETIAKSDSAAIFTVSNILSLNGETLNSYTGTIAVVDNVKPVMNSAKLNPDASITIGFNETLSVAPDADDLVVTVNGTSLATTDYSVAAITSGADYGKYLVTITNLKYDGSILYIDTDADGTRDANETVVTSIKVATSTSPNTAKDANNNFIKGLVEIVVK